MNARIEATPVESWSARNQRWLVSAMASLRTRIDATTDEALIRDSLDADAEAGFTPALLRCAQRFGLTPFERELLLLTAGIELDQGLRAAVQSRNAGTSSRATFSLALAVLTQPHWDALSPQSPLRYWQLIEPEPDTPLTQAELRIDERVLHFITGVPATDARLLGTVRYVAIPPAPAHDADAALVERMAQALRGHEDERAPIAVLHGEPPDAGAQRDLALRTAARWASSALWIHARDLPTDAAEQVMVARRIDREVALGGALPVLGLDAAGGEGPALALAEQLQSPLLWLGAPAAGLESMPVPRRVLRFDVPAPDAARTRAALITRWQDSSGDNDPAIASALERAAAQFHLGPGALDTLVDSLQSTPPALREDSVWNTAREAARGGLDALARRIVTPARFDDVVLPPAQLAALRDIAAQLRHRERVFRDWGFGHRHPRGQGLTALFAGESGTGKTLAAEAIANEVALDLYHVDLATLVSKYIGETEKNLKRLFDAAETSGAVLLFDEADALFGKRSEVKDSHDRYANIEVAYLLQRIEAYRGLAILTTNMKSALDRAFLRRLRFVVVFPFPDAAAREQIWRRQFPPAAPLGDIDFKALARMDLPGGHIRSIALHGAFKAAAGGGCIDQASLMGAARAEHAKLDRIFHAARAGEAA